MFILCLKSFIITPSISNLKSEISSNEIKNEEIKETHEEKENDYPGGEIKLKEQFESIHVNEKKVEEEDGKFNCYKCEKTFTLRSKLKEHFETAHTLNG